MKSFKTLIPASLVLLAACTGAAAQQVYRCGNSYSQTPCAGAVAVQTDDPRTAEQRAAAQQAQSAAKAFAKDMETTRRKEEAQALAADKLALTRAAAAHKTAEVKKPAQEKTRKKTGGIRTVKVKEPEFFTATDGAAGKQKKSSSKAAKP
jgi:hypothetical protein